MRTALRPSFRKVSAYIYVYEVIVSLLFRYVERNRYCGGIEVPGLFVRVTLWAGFCSGKNEADVRIIIINKKIRNNTIRTCTE